MSSVARLLGIRPGEGPLVAIVATTFAAIEAARGLGEVGADTLVLSRFGAEVLPYLFVGLGLSSLVASVGYVAALGRVRRSALLVGLLAGSGGLLVGLRLLLMAGEAVVLPLLWLTVYAAGTVATTIGWTVAGTVFDVRQAKRIFPVCTSAAIAGYFTGSLAAGPLARVLGTETLVVAQALLLGAGAALIARLANQPAGSRLRTVPGAAMAGGRAGGGLLGGLRDGLLEVLRSPLLRLVAIAYVIFSILQFSVTFPFLRAMETAFPDRADLATALGVLSAAVTATSFAVSLVVAPRLYARFGVATAALTLPLVYLAGFGLWLLQYSVATAAAVRFAQQVTQRGVSNAAWSAFYNVVPADRRAQVLAFNDGIPGQIGIALSGLLLLAAGRLLAEDQVFWMGAGAAVLCTIVVVGIRRRYAESLLRTLRAGLAERLLEGGPGLGALGGAPVTSALRAGLAAPDPAVRRTAAELLGRVGGGGAVAALGERLEDDDPGVRAAAVDALAALRRRPTGDGAAGPDAGATRDGMPAVRDRLAARLADPDPLVRRAAVRAVAAIDPARLPVAADGLIADPSPIVRAALAVALVRAGEEDRPHALLAALLEAPEPADRIAGLEAVGMLGGHSPSDRIPGYLADPDPGVRAAAVRALAAVDGMERLSEPFVAALDDESRVVRAAAAAVLRERPTAVTGIVEVLRDGSGRAQSAALAALDGHGPAARGALIDWSAGQVARAAELRRQREALRGARSAGAPVATGDRDGSNGHAGIGGESLEFLEFLVGRREADIELRLLDALGVLGAPEAGGLLRRCLYSNDPETRAQAIEALDSIGDARLRRGIVSLLDDRPGSGGRHLDAVLGELAGDADAWIRALALRSQAEQAARTWSTLRELGAETDDPIVRAALLPLVEHGGPPMPEPTSLLGEIDRMLFLRRVPLFRDLEPEDLQRIAAAATEARYAEGEALVREGDLGHEMVIIVEGRVRVVRIEPNGTERHLSAYGPGDHIGELALLRERPRAATVIAEPPGVRGLVIGGDGLMAILRERPEAAMAMLATLAERIGNQ